MDYFFVSVEDFDVFDVDVFDEICNGFGSGEVICYVFVVDV